MLLWLIVSARVVEAQVLLKPVLLGPVVESERTDAKAVCSTAYTKQI